MSSPGPFVRFSHLVAHAAGKPMTFAAACILILLWAVAGPIFQYSETWQLVVNTATTIITFLLVALLQNSQERADQAIQQKLNAIADSLSDLMESQNLPDDARELRQAVGLENFESSDGR